MRYSENRENEDEEVEEEEERNDAQESVMAIEKRGSLISKESQ